MLSIVIPSLDSAATLGSVLASVRRADGLDAEIVVVDGGSGDETRSLAEKAGARLIATSGGGRGPQLAVGAAAAGGMWLLFLHADTVLAPEWAATVAQFIADPGNRLRAGAFRFVLDDDRAAARRLEAIVAWRCRTFGLPYGDQGLLISREFYQACGGYRALPLMEDVDLVRQIGRHRLRMLDAAAVTSAARYRRGGYWRRPARNLLCLGLYFLGIPPRAIARLYG